MFRNPRENVFRTDGDKLAPSTGRPPSPTVATTFSSVSPYFAAPLGREGIGQGGGRTTSGGPGTKAGMTAASATVVAATSGAPTMTPTKLTRQTVTSFEYGAVGSGGDKYRGNRHVANGMANGAGSVNGIGNGMGGRNSNRSPGSANSSTPNKKRDGSILSFFKKGGGARDGGLLDRKDWKNGGDGLFFDDDNNGHEWGGNVFGSSKGFTGGEETVIPSARPDTVKDEWVDSVGDYCEDEGSGRFNEEMGPVKRARIESDDGDKSSVAYRSTDEGYSNGNEDGFGNGNRTLCPTDGSEVLKRHGPFVDESDSESESVAPRRIKEETPGGGMEIAGADGNGDTEGDRVHNIRREGSPADTAVHQLDNTEKYNGGSTSKESEQVDAMPKIERSDTNDLYNGDFEGFEGNEESDFEEYEGEEFQARRWMEEQRLLELEECQVDIDPANVDNGESSKESVDTNPENVASVSCPLCNATLAGLSDREASVHVNNCLDGNTPLPITTVKIEKPENALINTATLAKRFTHVLREPKPGQANPFASGPAGTVLAKQTSVFSKMMAGHAEDAAWADAAAAENASRGKPAYQRTCPFYKIMPGFSICVDAFRYGAVAGCEAYFLSHFHSDHYIGLTSTWCHGPIYCSKVTGNLVKQQLRVDPKYVISIEFEESVEIPRTGGARVTMIPANHCPGSSLFLFEKKMGTGSNPRLQRILHCGDFRACPAHIEHPLLSPDAMDAVTKKSKQQKIDVCYLDTTYLNPKYAFPSQEEVIKACADMCVSLNKQQIDETDDWELTKREREGSIMTKFVRSDSGIKQEIKEEDGDDTLQSIPPSNRGRLLVVVGTYSIGKERICMGIAKALNSKIYAPPGKQRICACLEDSELSARLTTNPREAQVHMTPLFEIRAETLGDYLKDYRQIFSRAVGFRPSGWNYRPPNSRFVESPSVQTVLYSQNWKSTYAMRDLVPQRGSTAKASCFGVPYSEHSSFRELTIFCCALRIERVIPTVNVGSAKSRERMKAWTERWALEKKKNGLFRVEKDGVSYW